MLKHLYIKNYALIEELSIDFQNGFSVITGETGAGKSILLGAINLLLGHKAESKNIKTGASRCVIEAEFHLNDFGLESFFEENDFDFEDSICTIRRELSATGKSRAFINDTPASVGQLKELGCQIIDIHSQHQNLLLSNEDFQMEVVDLLGNNIDNLKHYFTVYSTYKKQEVALKEMQQKVAENKENIDFLQFQLKQLCDFNPIAGEDETLQEEADEQTHAEEIKTALYEAANMMYNEPHSIVQAIRQVRQTVGSLERYVPKAAEWTERLESAYIELKDLYEEIDSKAESVSYDPKRLEALNERLDQLYSLEKKHHVDSAEKLVELKESLQQKLDEIENGDDNIAELERELAKSRQELHEKGKVLTAERAKAGTMLQEQMHTMLCALGMPNARLEVKLTPLPAPSAKGMDQVTFLFSANKSSATRPISEVASGGEISRVMLALKVILSNLKQLPTVIFDEIDTGVSGNIAECMAQMMKKLASNQGMQVISITHLPQIAAIGTSHYRVYKEDHDEQTNSHIVRLNEEERIHEIANMLSGAHVSQAAIENAKQLLKS